MPQATKPQLRPLHDRVLVKRVEEEHTRRSGIVIPDAARGKPQEGQVIAVGPGKATDDGTKTALDIKAGDRVLFGTYSGSEIELDGEAYIVMKEEDVLGILGS